MLSRKLSTETDIKYAKNLVDSDSNWYAGAKHLELLLSGPLHDIFVVDVYYHQSCYLHFTKTKNKH